jgi:Nif-specific regulatory protein
VDDSARYRLLYDLGCAFAARLELDELLALILEECRTALDAEGAAILRHDRERDELEFRHVADEAPVVAARVAPLRIPANRGIAGAVLASGRALRVDDAQRDPRFYPGVDQVSAHTTRGLLTVPIRARDATVGVLQVMNRRGEGRFDDGDLAFLDALAGSVAIALENARLHAALTAREEKLQTPGGALRRDLARRDREADMVGTAPCMADVFRLVESAATSPIPVLIEGETGTGKELIARAIHRAGARAEKPFLAVNCAAFQETLLESELFGHRRGAFTGATQDRRGFFEAASGGTLFLDEVGDMPPPMQAKLLRVLQEQEIVPVGDTVARRIDVRIVAATNRDLAAEVERRAFREDLYYRLAAFPIRLPPLRQRPEDIPMLAERFLRTAAARAGKRVAGIDPQALESLVSFAWPGNVRELENEMQRAVALAADGETIRAAHLSAKLQAPTPAAEADAVVSDGTLRRARAAFEVRFLTAALKRHDGNVSRTATSLGLSRVMLQRKMKEYGLR